MAMNSSCTEASHKVEEILRGQILGLLNCLKSLKGFGISLTTLTSLVIKTLMDPLTGPARAPFTWIADLSASNTGRMRVKEGTTQDPITCRPQASSSKTS